MQNRDLVIKYMEKRRQFLNFDFVFIYDFWIFNNKRSIIIKLIMIYFIYLSNGRIQYKFYIFIIIRKNF